MQHINVKTEEKQRRNYRKTDFENFRKEMDKIVWDDLLRKDTLDGVWKAFCDNLYELEENYVPLVKVRGNKSR
jgi:hypothetical protein